MTSNKLKILFIGTVDFSYSCLEKLIEEDFLISGVITKEKSNFNSDFKDLTPLCQHRDIPIFYDDNLNDKSKESFISQIKPDIIYCFGWSHILSRNILDSAPHGVVGYHPALLPSNRGRHPIIWALFLGLKKTGSTFFIMDEGADTGDIISQEEVSIDSEDNASSLYEKIKQIALNQIVVFSNDLQKKGTFTKKIPQDLNTGNNWRKRGPIDGKIDFRMNSISIYNLVRSLTHPYVGAHIETKDGNIKVWEVSLVKGKYPPNIEPGKILKIEGGSLIVKTYDNAISIDDHGFINLPKKNSYL